MRVSRMLDRGRMRPHRDSGAHFLEGKTRVHAVVHIAFQGIRMDELTSRSERTHRL